MNLVDTHAESSRLYELTIQNLKGVFMADVTPATGTVVGVVAGIVLEVLGVDVPPLVWSAVGAALMQGYSSFETTKCRAAIQVVASTLLGTVIGLTITDLGNISYEPAKFLACALGGFGAHPVLQALLKRLLEKIEGTPK